MTSKYQEKERAKAENLIKVGDSVFYGGKAGKFFMTKNRDFVLLDRKKNIYSPICADVIEYFRENNISWWGGKLPTGHVLSSQIACVNYLFNIRSDKSAVMAILRSISDDFQDVYPITTDKYLPAFIQFESVSDNDYLNEGKPTRGNNCTSIDALIFAQHNDGSKWLIPIEWKYTEFYSNQNKAIEGYKADPIDCKGEVRKRRYTDLINKSKQLKSFDHTCFYFEPFYQLMRQTLWAEQMVINNKRETLKAENYLHVHVIPPENGDLLNKVYKCSGLDMEHTWRNHLTDQSKYVIISPKKLLSGIDNEKYQNLLKYINGRYQ